MNNGALGFPRREVESGTGLTWGAVVVRVEDVGPPTTLPTADGTTNLTDTLLDLEDPSDASVAVWNASTDVYEITTAGFFSICAKVEIDLTTPTTGIAIPKLFLANLGSFPANMPNDIIGAHVPAGFIHDPTIQCLQYLPVGATVQLAVTRSGLDADGAVPYAEIAIRALF